MASTEPITSTTVSPFVWPTRPLGELEASGILSVRNGFSCGTHNVGGEGIPHLRPFNVTEHGRLSFDVIKAIPSRPGMETYALLAGDVLYNNTNSEELVGKCAYWPGRESLHVLSNHMTILRTLDPNQLRPRFLALYLLWLWMTGAARRLCRRHVNQASIGLERMRQIAIPLPPARDQHAIADSLTKIQSAADIQDRIVAVLKVIKAATMAKLFREGVRGEPLKQTEIGEIPESWDVVRLGDHCRMASGGTPARDVGAYWGGDIPWVKTAEIDYRPILTTEERITQVGLENSSARVFPKGTLLMAMYGQGVTRGKVAVLEIEAATNQACAALFPDETLDPGFLDAFCVHAYDAIRNLGHGANQKNLSADILREIRLPRPPSLDEQREVSHVLRALEGRLHLAEKTRRMLETLFSSTLHLLMTGQMRVTRRMIALQAVADRGARRPKWSGTVDGAVLQEVVRRIVEAVAPEKIILFGSAARGQMGPDSDLDLLVVKACENRREVSQAIYRSLRGIGGPKDVVVVTPEDVEEQKDIPGMVVRAALREGRVLYAA